MHFAPLWFPQEVSITILWRLDYYSAGASYHMNTKAWIYSIITYVVLTVGLILLSDYIWPDNKVISLIIPLVVGAIITHFVRKIFDFITDFFNCKIEKPFLGVLIKVDHTSRRFTGYGASCGEVIQAGYFKANYEVELELNVTIQNESPYTAYELDVSYIPNQYLEDYILIDNRENKLQPLEGNKHFVFTLRIMRQYYDVYASEVDKDIQQIYKLGKEISLLNGSKLIIKYKDSKHEDLVKTEVID